MENEMEFYLYDDISGVPSSVLKKKLNGYRSALNLPSVREKSHINERVEEAVCRIENELSGRRELIVEEDPFLFLNDREEMNKIISPYT